MQSKYLNIETYKSTYPGTLRYLMLPFLSVFICTALFICTYRVKKQLSEYVVPAYSIQDIKYKLIYPMLRSMFFFLHVVRQHTQVVLGRGSTVARSTMLVKISGCVNFFFEFLHVSQLLTCSPCKQRQVEQSRYMLEL